MDEKATINTELIDLSKSIVDKVLEKIGQDKKNSIHQVKQIVFDLLYDRIKESIPHYSEQDYNEFVDYYNAVLFSIEKAFEEHYENDNNEMNPEISNYCRILDQMQLTSLDGITTTSDEERRIIYYDIAAIVFFYLRNTVADNQIKIADLGRYLPDDRGLDTNYEFANGLIVREVMDFWESNKSFQENHTIKGYLPFSSNLETLIFKNKYSGIDCFEGDNKPENIDGVIVNVPYISVPYKYDEPLNTRIIGIAKIDFDRLNIMLEEALKVLSLNGSLFLVFRMMDIFCNEDSSGARHFHPLVEGKIQPIPFFEECPSLAEWSELYSAFSKFGLEVDSIIKTSDDPNYDAPGFEGSDYLDSCGVIILRNAKSNINKQFYSVVDLAESLAGITVELLEKLSREVVSGTRITENDLIAEYYNKKVEFNGYLIDTKNKEIFYKKQAVQLQQGFKELSGRDFAKRINHYSVDSNNGFEENEQSVFIPLNGDLLTKTYITFSIDEFEKRIVKTATMYGQLNWENIPWYTFVLKVLDDPALPADKKEKIDNALHDFRLSVWNEYRFFDITQFGFNIRDYVIYYDEKVIQELEIDEDKYFNTEREAVAWALKMQALKSNVFEVILNPKFVLPAYLQLLFKTNVGEIYFRELGYKDSSNSRIEAFLSTKITVPPVELQSKLLQHDAFIEEQKRQLDTLKNTFYDYLGCGDRYSDSFNFVVNYDYGAPDLMHSLIATIPQPIASILYIDECEGNTARKNINYYHLFEAISLFHATVLLSMIKRIPSCREIFDIIISETFLFGVAPKKRDIRADFGLWTNLLSRIVENCSEYMPFDKQVNEEMLAYLNKARKRRNTQMGHAPRWSDVKERELYVDLKNLAKDIMTCFKKLYSGYELIVGPFRREDADSENNTGYVHCYKAVGPNPRFAKERIEVKGYSRFLNHRLYLAEQGTWNKPVELLPLIKYMPLCEEDDKLNSLGYFHSANLISIGNNINRNITWCSYDCGDNYLLTKKYNEDLVTRDLIDFLLPYWVKKVRRQSI